MNLFTELKRRNVFRVALFYIVAAWVVIQVAETLLPVFDVPDSAIRIIVLILALGFPLAVVFSWVFELTPEGLKRDKDVHVDPEVKQQTAHKLNWATLAAAVLAIGLLVADRMVPEPATTTAPLAALENGDVPETASMDKGPDPASIAVLPFADLSPEGDQQYFSDGIAEELLNVLVRVDGLAVASRTSSFQFKGMRAIGIPAIAGQLNVRHILEGSVRTAGDSIRVTAQLIDADSDQHLWSETYDRELSTQNLFNIQDEIASAIVGAIRDQLDVELDTPASVEAITGNVDAYAMFLRARALFRARSDFREIDLLLQQAIALDPAFADALALRAAVLSISPEYGVVLYGDATESSVMSLDLASRALEIDPVNGLAIGVLGLREDFKLYRDEFVTLSEVLARYDEALEQAPNNLNLLNWRGHLYMRIGDFGAAERDFIRCLEIESAMVPCRNNRVGAILLSGRTEEADRAFSEALRLGTLGADMSTLMMVHQLGREDAFYMQALRQPPLRGWLDMGELHYALDNPGEDHRVLRQRLLAHAQSLGAGTEYAAADILIALGDYDLMTVSYAFWFAPYSEYRRSEHFKRFVRRLGIPDYWRTHGFPPQCRTLGEDDFECD
jgi:TolB-like protein